MPAVDPVTSARLPLSPRSMIDLPPLVFAGEQSRERGGPRAILNWGDCSWRIWTDAAPQVALAVDLGEASARCALARNSLRISGTRCGPGAAVAEKGLQQAVARRLPAPQDVCGDQSGGKGCDQQTKKNFLDQASGADQNI